MRGKRSQQTEKRSQSGPYAMCCRTSAAVGMVAARRLRHQAPSTGSRPGSQPTAARSPEALTLECVRMGAFASCSPAPMAPAALPGLVRAFQIPIRVRKVLRSAFSQWRPRPPSARSWANSAFDARVAALRADSGRAYGQPRDHRALSHSGIRVSHKQVRRSLRRLGLTSAHRKLYRVPLYYMYVAFAISLTS